LLEGLILTCTLSSQLLTVDYLNEYFSCHDRNEIIVEMQDYIPVMSKYFKDDDVELALRITFCESSGNPNAINKNTNNTYDKGLWQFNDHTWNWLKPKLKIKNSRFDVDTSTAVASWLIYNDTVKHWSASEKCWRY